MSRLAGIVLGLAAAAVSGCGSTKASPAPQSEASADAAQNAAAATPAPSPAARPAFPPWKRDGECYWVLTYPDGVAHRAWIGNAETGLFLSLVDDSMVGWPVSDTLPLRLVRDGGAARSVAARGSHGDGDGATLLTIILDEPQRALLDGAREIAIEADGRAGFVLPMAGAPDADALEACDPPGPGEFTEQ